MTTKQFIDDTFGVPSNTNRKCSSVFADTDGNIYSYGYHYPLLFKVDGLTFRNTSGYSTTTAKHISYCSRFDAIDVELDVHDRLRSLTLADIEERLEMMRDKLYGEMVIKKRKDTWVYHDLERRHERTKHGLAAIKVYA
jgi:hypothetical protein